MKRMTSNLTSAFVVLLLLAAAVTTANSQEQRKASYIYGLGNDGTLKRYLHIGATTGAGNLQGPNNVGGGWNNYKSAFPGGANIIYGIKADGTLEWRQHKGVRTGSDEWGDAKTVGRGWGDFVEVFSGGNGIIYAMTQEGKLLWYKHNGYLDGRGVGSPGAWEGPKEVGSGWNSFKQVFPGGDDIIYAIARDGKLLWYRHIGYADGVKAWEGPKEVGRGWGDFKQVFSSGDGVIYAITADGKLKWRKYNGYLTGGGYDTWQGPAEIATGWSDFIQVFALLPGSSTRPPDQQPRTSRIVTPLDESINESGATRAKVNADALGTASDVPQYQELRCRGGDGLRFVVVEGRIASSGDRTMYMRVYFKPAAQPAGESGRNLQPGQCAFAERALRADEPNEIILEIVSFGQLREKLHGSAVDTSPTAAERYPDAKNVPQYLGDAKHYWSFFVRQNAPLPFGLFEASYGRYWKPAISLKDVIRQSPDGFKGRKPVVIPPQPE